MRQKRPVANVKKGQEEDGGMGVCPQKTFLGPNPQERPIMPFWNMGECCRHHSSSCSEEKIQ